MAADREVIKAGKGRSSKIPAPLAEAAPDSTPQRLGELRDDSQR